MECWTQSKILFLKPWQARLENLLGLKDKVYVGCLKLMASVTDGTGEALDVISCTSNNRRAS